MKRLIGYIIFFGLIACLASMASPASAASQPVETEKVSQGVDEGQKFVAVIIDANQSADLSLQQSNSAGQAMRRCRSVTDISDKMTVSVAEFQSGHSERFYRMLSSDFQDYFAQQKLIGYYIYTLCKIII